MPLTLNLQVTFVESFPSSYTRVVNQFTWIQSLNNVSGGQPLNTTGHKDYVGFAVLLKLDRALTTPD